MVESLIELYELFLLGLAVAAVVASVPAKFFWAEVITLGVAALFGGVIGILELLHGPPASLGIALLALRREIGARRLARWGVVGALAGGAALLAFDGPPPQRGLHIPHQVALGWSILFAAAAAWAPATLLRGWGGPLLALCAATTPLANESLVIVQPLRVSGNGVFGTLLTVLGASAMFLGVLLVVLGSGLLLAWLTRRLGQEGAGRWLVSALCLALASAHGWALLRSFG